MKTFEEAMEALKSVDGGSDLVAAVTERIGKVNSEAKGLREAKESLEAKLSEAQAEVSKAKEKSGKPSEKEKTLEQRITAIEKERDDAIHAKQGSERDQAILAALTESKALPTVLKGLKDVLALSVKHKEDGTPYMLGDDGKELPISEGVKGYLKQNPGFVANDQAAGSGTNGGVGGTGKKTISRSDFNSLAPVDQMAFAKAGNSITD